MRSDISRAVRRTGLARLLWTALLLSGCGMLIGVEDSKVQGTCGTDAECAPGYGCLRELCRSECENDQECGADSRCLRYGVAGACIPNTEGCGEGDAGCPDGTVCAGKVCRTSCTDNEECAGDQACQQVETTLGVCVGTDAKHDPFTPGGSGSGGSGGSGGMSSGGNGGSAPVRGGESSGGATGGGEGGPGGAGPTEPNPEGPGLGNLDEPCAGVGTRACAGHAQRQQLLCEDGVWRGNGTCPPDQHCDTREGTNQGLCQATVPGCEGQSTDTPVCRDNDVVLCDADQVSTTLVTKCTACDSGSCSCPAGTRGVDGSFVQCEACETGSFTAEPSLKECATWATCQAGTRVTNTPSATTDRVCAACPPGKITTGPNQTECLDPGACPAGTIQLAPGSCADCDDGTYCAGGTAPAVTCAAGSWDHDADPATACAAKTTCLAGQRVSDEGSTTKDRTCAGCTAGTYSAATNAASCTSCGVGSYSAAGASSCTTCAAGTWDHDASSATACINKTTCTAGQAVTSEGTTTTDRTCTTCPAGKYSSTSNATSCTSCPAGTYSSTSGATSCTSCAAGAYNSTTNATSCTTCAAACSAAAATYESTACTATTNRVCSTFPSCQGLTANCGASSNDNCCASPTVTGGNFKLGTGTANSATVADFALDKYEVTVGRFRKFVAAYAGPPANGAGAHKLIANSGWSTNWNNLIAADSAALTTAVKCDLTTQTWNTTGVNDRLPMNCVSWFEAFAFCAWDAGRLPTEAEWEYAAAGGGFERIYPWGNTPGPTDVQTTPPFAYANYGCMGDGSAFGSCTVNDILAVGSKSMGAGRYLQLDLAGSVWEWGLDWYANYVANCNNCADVTDPSATTRVARGGGWQDSGASLVAAGRVDVVPDSHFDFMGFRCARAN